MLLTEMLQLLVDGGLHSTAELARRLGVSEGLVAAMTEDLARRGYLAAVRGHCDTACAGCGIQAACVEPGAAATVPILLSLTDKGQRAARRAQDLPE